MLDKPQSRHPETKVQISGIKLPHWQDSLKLSINAHKALQGYVLIGWDIVITNNGSMLLEGNAGWDVNIVQKPQDHPLGKTCLLALFDSWQYD